MLSETFQSHYNPQPQPSAKTPPATTQPAPKPLTPPETVKPVMPVEPTPTPAKIRKAINFSSASA